MSRLSGGSPSAPRWSASPSPRAPRFRRSELAAVGRRELLRWVNRTVGVEYVQVESCADGVALAQLVDAAYPDARVPLYRLDFATRHEHDRARNLEVVRATLDRLDLDVPLDVKEMSRGAYRACDEALRWLYLVVQRERHAERARVRRARAAAGGAGETQVPRARAVEKPGLALGGELGRRERRRLLARGGGVGGGDGGGPRRRRAFLVSFRPRLSMDDGGVQRRGSDGGRGLEMSVDSLDVPVRKTTHFPRRREKKPRDEKRELRSRGFRRERKTQSDDWRGRGRGRGPAPPSFGRRRRPSLAAARPSPSSRARAWTSLRSRSLIRGDRRARRRRLSRRPGTKPFVAPADPVRARSSLSPRPPPARLYRRAGRWTSGRRRRA